MAKRRNTRAVEARRLAGLRERAKAKAKSLLMRKGVATMAGAGMGALAGTAMVKAGIKPTTSAAMLTTAGVVGMATLEDIPHAIAIGVGGMGVGQLALMLLNKEEVKDEVRNQALPEGAGLHFEDVDPRLLDSDIADEFRNARDAYASEYPPTYADPDLEAVLEVA